MEYSRGREVPLLYPGDQIDRFTIEARLGEGGMAEVYLVTNQSTGGKQALKLLKSGDPAVAVRLQREAQVQARLLHPHIVSVSDVVQVDGQPGLVMEYIDGPSLDAWLQTAAPDLPTRLTVFRAILRGLARAHAEGVVHRDLSPRNILVQRTAHGPHPKITDFGLAKLLDPGAGPAQTREGAPMGTPAYMAPEQVRDAATVDARADIWALGALLYLLATDTVAFQGRDLLDTWNRVSEGRYPPLPSGLPEAVRRTVVACLQVDPERRPKDVAAVEALLEEGPGERGLARLDGAGLEESLAPLDQPVKRPIMPIAVVAGAILSLVAVVVMWPESVQSEVGSSAAMGAAPAVVEAAPEVVEPAPAAVESAPKDVEPPPSAGPTTLRETSRLAASSTTAEAPPADSLPEAAPAWTGATWRLGADAPATLCLEPSKGGDCLPPGPVPEGSFRIKDSKSKSSVGIASVPERGVLVAWCKDGGCQLEAQ